MEMVLFLAESFRLQTFVEIMDHLGVGLLALDRIFEQLLYAHLLPGLKEPLVDPRVALEDSGPVFVIGAVRN